MHVRNVCLKRDRLPDADMVGFNMVGHMAVQLDLEHPDSAHWPDSPLKIRPSSLRAISRAIAPEESTDAMSLVRFDRALSQPGSVQAGQTLKIEVLLKPLALISPMGCGAPIRSEVWHSVDLIGLTPPQMFDRCRLSARPDGSYLAVLEKDFPADSFPGFYYVDMIALQVSADRGGLAIAKPSVPLRFEVQSAEAPAPLRILSYGFVGVTGHKLTAEREYVFEVRIENARDIFDGLVSGQAAADDGF